MKKMLLGLIVAIGAMLALSACQEKETPTSVTKAYYEAVVARDFKTAMNYCCKKDGAMFEEKQKETLVGLMNEKVKDEKQSKHFVAKYEIGEETIAEDGKTAVVKVKTTSVGGEELQVESNCILVDGKWYVNTGK